MCEQTVVIVSSNFEHVSILKLIATSMYIKAHKSFLVFGVVHKCMQQSMVNKTYCEVMDVHMCIKHSFINHCSKNDSDGDKGLKINYVRRAEE